MFVEKDKAKFFDLSTQLRDLEWLSDILYFEIRIIRLNH